MGRLIVKAVDHKYRETYRPERTIINGLNNNNMVIEIIKELTAINCMGSVTNGQVLV